MFGVRFVGEVVVVLRGCTARIRERTNHEMSGVLFGNRRSILPLQAVPSHLLLQAALLAISIYSLHLSRAHRVFGWQDGGSARVDRGLCQIARGCAGQ